MTIQNAKNIVIASTRAKQSSFILCRLLRGACPEPSRRAYNDNKAFTLIELMIVISIIGILLSIGIGAYSTARRSIILDMEADKLVATLNAYKSETKNSPKCVGIKFTKNSQPQRMETSYLSEERKCDLATKFSTINLAREVSISNLVTDGISQNSMSVLFVPPQGAAEVVPRGVIDSITLILKSTGANRRIITLNSDSGTITKQKN